MTKNHIFRVAGHRFEVEGEMPSLPNLLPFASESQEEPLLFTLHLVQSLPLTPVAPFYQTEDGPGFPEIAIDRYEDGSYRFRVRPLPGEPVAGELRASADFHEAWLSFTGSDDAFALNNSLMLLFAFSSAHAGLLEMHASVVMNGGKGYLFLGRSGTGKSTHSSLWLKHIPGTELLNDDNPILRLMPDGSARVYGSPWSGKTPCYKSKDAPVGAIVQLKQAPFNKIAKMHVINSYVSLMESASSFRPFKSLADGWHRTMEGICSATPFYFLECLPDRDAALLCYNKVNGIQNPA